MTDSTYTSNWPSVKVKRATNAIQTTGIVPQLGHISDGTLRVRRLSTASSESADVNVYRKVVEVVVTTDEERRIVFIGECNRVCIGK